MTAIPSGTQFVGLSATYPTTERRSNLVNSGSEVYTIEDIATAVGGGGIEANGFTIVGPIAANVTLPENAVVNYTGPLSMAAGYILTVPTGTTLNIL
jgi:hypothetical protein